MLRSVPGCAVLVVTMFALVASGACPPRSENNEILDSVDQFIIRQMDKFTLPTGYPVGYNEPCLLQTYDVGLGDPLHFRADVYDSALAAIYILERGANFHGGDYLGRARSIVDGIRLVQDHDPVYEHAVRTSYWADDLYNETTGLARIDQGDVGTGNNSFAALALTRFYHATGEQVYLDAAKGMADFIDTEFRQTDTVPPIFNGYSMGIDAAGNPHHPDGRSTEHNVDVYAMARSLAETVSVPDPYDDMAQHAKYFVDRMFDSRPGEGKYWLGTKHDETLGRVINYWPVSADAQAWTTLASLGGAGEPLQDRDRCEAAMDWLWANLTKLCPCPDPDCYGVIFTNGGQGIQSEVSASAAMAYLLLGEEERAESILTCLDWVRLSAPGSDPGGIGLVATPDPAGAPTGFGGVYPNARHVASTVWLGLTVLQDEYPEQFTANPFAVVPEPATLSILLLAGLAVIRRRRE